MNYKTAAASILATLLLLPAVSFAQSRDSTVTRANVRSELKQLERAGFQPGAANIDYPNELQAAQRRIQQSGRSNRVTLPLSAASSK